MYQIRKIIFYFYLIIFGSFLFLSFILYSEFSRINLEFYVFNVGQGDAIFIRTPDKYNILIDGGPDNTVVYKLGKYLPFYDHQIDLMILTHPHSDHVVGLVEVLKRYQVKKILITGVEYNSPDYSAWLDKISEKDVPTVIVDRPGKIFLGQRVELIILIPDQSLFKQKIKNLNNTSIVTKLLFASSSIILMGDFEDEESLLSKDLKADILKVGHHGSKTANDPKFLEAVKPEIAVISCGQGNKFNHPSQQILDNLRNLGIKIWRTDKDGDFQYKLAGP